MSKLTTRVLLSVLISLGVIVGIYISVLGASPWGNRTGSLVGGANLNLDRYRSAEVQQRGVGSQSDLIAPGGASQGHGCESELQFDPSDL